MRHSHPRPYSNYGFFGGLVIGSTNLKFGNPFGLVLLVWLEKFSDRDMNVTFDF